jgi:endoglucanase
MFEVLNEPNQALTPELWNSYLVEALAIIRTSNPTRNVILGPGYWNSIDHLDDLELPNDKHLIVTVHYYTPMRFTHQGASWTPENANLSGITWGSDEDFAQLKTNFARVQAWADAHHRPILLGEFGAYDKGTMADRVRWTSAVAREAEAHHWAWAYWQFDSDFIVYDIDKDQWVTPIRDALIPNGH